ncbi:MAG: energy-coupling factor ABC transporter permease, partial [Candidatus Margulisiibacteriota bacterium]
VTAVVSAKALATAGAGANKVLNSGRRMLTNIGRRQIYKMGMTAVLIFAAQAFDFPVGGGTSGHLTGGVLAAVLLGPFAGTIVISVVLAVQMLFLADGGLFALGANIVNMAIIGSLGSYYIYHFLKKVLPQTPSVMIAAWCSVVLAALSCSLQIGLSGKAELAQIAPSMLKTHIVVGLAEAFITVAAISAFNLITSKDADRAID